MDNLPLTPISQVQLHLPMKVEGFVDFLTSVDHAERAGRAFGEGELPLNFFHLPTAYHGRASTVVVSGTDIVRPWVQTRPAAGVTTPNWGPCKALDYELEMVRLINGLANLRGALLRGIASSLSLWGWMRSMNTSLDMSC
jgi:fumarylacetoacetase